MEAPELIPDFLNEQQIMMLRLLKTPMAESDFMQIRRLAVKLLSQKIDDTVDEWETKNNITLGNYEQLSKMHFRAGAKH